MHKVDVSIHWWDLKQNILGKEHTLYSDLFRSKFIAELMRWTMFYFSFWFLKMTKNDEIGNISSFLRKTGMYFSPVTKEQNVVMEIYKPMLTSAVTRVKSESEFKKIWAPNLSLH